MAQKIQPIQFCRRIRNPKMINAIKKLSCEWDMTFQETVYKILHDSLITEYNKMIYDSKKND